MVKTMVVQIATLQPMENPCRSRLQAVPVMLWRAALSGAGFLASPVMLQWAHTGAVLEKLQTVGRTHIRFEGLCPMDRTSQLSRGKV